MLKIAVGCDPNAASAKAALMQYLGQKGFLLTDFGSDDPIYANVAIKVAEAVSRKEYDRGILICGTGLGVSIAAKKQPPGTAGEKRRLCRADHRCVLRRACQEEQQRKYCLLWCLYHWNPADGKTGRDLSLLRVYSRVRISAKDRSNCRL